MPRDRHFEKQLWWLAFWVILACGVAWLISGCAVTPPSENQRQWQRPNLEQRLSDAIKDEQP